MDGVVVCRFVETLVTCSVAIRSLAPESPALLRLPDAPAVVLAARELVGRDRVPLEAGPTSRLGGGAHQAELKAHNG